MSGARQEAVVHFFDAFHHVTRKGIIFLRIFWHPIGTIRTTLGICVFTPNSGALPVTSKALWITQFIRVGRLLSVIAFVLNVASQCF